MHEASNSAVQSHYALYRYMSVMLWNAIITVGISVTSLIIASTLCMYYYTLYMYMHVLSSYTHMVYMYSVWNIERSWPGFENEGRIYKRDGQETCCEQARIHQQTSRASETSQRGSVKMNDVTINLMILTINYIHVD